MRRLSIRQVVRCETAKTRRCRCRCGGLLHGAGRLTDPDDHAALEHLDELDPHKPGAPRQLELF